MYSDFANNSAKVSKESSYRLKALQTPALIFDTYSYLHVLADPDNSVNGGEIGQGLKSDFEFAIYGDSVTAEKITLVGRVNQSTMVLTEATPTEAAAYVAGKLATNQQFENLTKYQKYFKRVTINGIVYEMLFNPKTRLITLSWLEGSVVKSFSSNYYYTTSGVTLTVPFVSGSLAIYNFDDVSWDETRTQVGFAVNGVRTTVVAADAPLKIDTGAPRAWWLLPQAEESYWESYEAFHINGEDDALGFTDLRTDTSEYYRFFYWPDFNTSYDAFGPFFINDGALDLPYGAASRRPTFTTDGRVVFTAYGTLGREYPTTGPMVEAAKLFYDTRGFYLIKTSDTSYDMVSASDARVWISWSL